MSSVNVHVQGFGTVVVPRPKGVNHNEFDKIVGDAVANTVSLIHDRDMGFHPAMGLGGHSWDHVNQRYIPPEIEPEVWVEPSRRKKILISIKKAFGRA